MSDILKRSPVRYFVAARSGRSGAIAGIVGLVIVQQAATMGSTSLLAETWTNAFHIPLFAILALLLIRVLRGPSWSILLLVCLAIAAVTEALQALTDRNASLFDLGLDLLGALPVIGAFAATHGADRPVEARAGRVAVWIAAVLFLAVITIAAPARVMLAYAERDEVFPVLLIPEAWKLRPLLWSNSETRLVPGPDRWPGHAGEPVVEVVWADQRYPGITLSEVVPDWHGFAFLSVDVFLADGPPLPLTAAVGHQGLQGTAAYLRRTVEPGAQRLFYEVPPLLQTTTGAPPRISKLILHTSRDHAGRRLLIGSVALVPAE